MMAMCSREPASLHRRRPLRQCPELYVRALNVVAAAAFVVAVVVVAVAVVVVVAVVTVG